MKKKKKIKDLNTKQKFCLLYFLKFIFTCFYKEKKTYGKEFSYQKMKDV